MLLGAGLDTFAQRRPDLAARLRVFEVDQPGHAGLEAAAARPTSATASRSGCGWSRSTSRRARPGGTGWPKAGFDPGAPAVVASTGVSMYLTREANAATLRELAALAPGSTVAMTFLLPLGPGR